MPASLVQQPFFYQARPHGHRVSGSFPGNARLHVAGRYDGSLCHRPAHTLTSERGLPGDALSGGTGGRPPGRYRLGASLIGWRFLPSGSRLAGYGGSSSRGTTAPLVNADFVQTPVIVSSAAATLPVTLVMRTGVMTVDLFDVFLAANACSR